MSLSKEELFEVVKAQGHSNRMITAHWTGVDNTVLFDDYHLCIDGNAQYHQMLNFDEKGAHSYMENTGNFGIAVCSNKDSQLIGDGYTGYSTYVEGPEPVNYLQLDALAYAIYLCCVTWGIPLNKVYTHGERCLARQDLYDDVCEKWDLDILVPECHIRTTDGIHTTGGNWLRNRVKEIAAQNGCYL